jgi:hypothetical protein
MPRGIGNPRGIFLFKRPQFQRDSRYGGTRFGGKLRTIRQAVEDLSEELKPGAGEADKSLERRDVKKGNETIREILKAQMPIVAVSAFAGYTAQALNFSSPVCWGVMGAVQVFLFTLGRL